jgi:hypothetical protein
MSIDDPNAVDYIGTDNTTGEVVLTISDHLDWSDPPAHINLLQEKLNSYLAFYESGDIYVLYPDARGRPVRILVMCKYPIDSPGIRFFEHAEAVLDGAGLRLTARTPNKSPD